jgi:hypothetical protein
MSEKQDLGRLQGDNRLLRTHNRRYREIIQNLSSRVSILEAQRALSHPGAPVLEAFETFGSPSRSQGAKVEDLSRTYSLKSWGPNVLPPPSELNALVPNPGWRCLAVDRPQLRIGFTLFGMTEQEIEETVAVVEQKQVRSRDFVPVFVTDRTDLAPFRSRGYVVELVPRSLTQKRRELAASPMGLSQRLEHIESKWGLHKLLDLGRKGLDKDLGRMA